MKQSPHHLFMGVCLFGGSDMKLFLITIMLLISPLAKASDNFFDNKLLFEAYLDNAKQGEALSQFVIAKFYEGSDIKNSDLDKVIYWYQKAAEKKFPQAANNLGYVYDMINSDEEAEYWYKQAVDLGYTPALVNLGLLYFDKGPLHNYVQSFNYFQQAATFNEYESLFHMGLAYKEGLGVEPDLSKAFYWLKQSAESGNPKAMRELGLMYKNGIHVKQDYNMAEKYLKQGANLRDVESIHSLAVFYFGAGDLGTPESHANFEKTLFYMQEAAMLGHPQAKHKMSIIFKQGLGVIANSEISSLLSTGD